MIQRSEFENLRSNIEDSLGRMRGRYVYGVESEAVMSINIDSLITVVQGVEGVIDIISTKTVIDSNGNGVLKLTLRPRKSSRVEGYKMSRSTEFLLVPTLYDNIICWLSDYAYEMSIIPMLEANLSEVNEIARGKGIQFVFSTKKRALESFEEGVAKIGLSSDAIIGFGDFPVILGSSNIEYTFENLTDPLDIFYASSDFAKSLGIKTRKSKESLLKSAGVV